VLKNLIQTVPNDARFGSSLQREMAALPPTAAIRQRTIAITKILAIAGGLY
jgi:hypothetical protein